MARPKKILQNECATLGKLVNFNLLNAVLIILLLRATFGGAIAEQHNNKKYKYDFIKCTTTKITIIQQLLIWSDFNASYFFLRKFVSLNLLLPDSKQLVSIEKLSESIESSTFSNQML